MLRLTILAALFTAARCSDGSHIEGATDLTEATFDDTVFNSGKSVFVRLARAASTPCPLVPRLASRAARAPRPLLRRRRRAGQILRPVVRRAAALALAPARLPCSGLYKPVAWR